MARNGVESEILNQLREDADDARRLFSNPGQALQERTAVAGLLRVLGVSFEEREIVKRGPEPIDAWFREARFQVTEVLDPERRRNGEWRKIAERRHETRSLNDLVEPGVISSSPASPDEVLGLVHEACLKKHAKCGVSCGGVDALVYVNLERRHLYPTGPWPDTTELEDMDWRSVSVIMEPYAAVLLARNDAPSFLRVVAGRTLHWPGLNSCFPVFACRPASGCS